MPAKNKLGYAVIGLGSLSQAAVLPAFAHAKQARLVALVTGNREKGKSFARKFHAKHVFAYDEFADCLGLPEVEAVYLAVPPGRNEEFAVAAAHAGKHVLAEKPLAASVGQARSMVEACRKNSVQLMTAYRKYFDPATVRLKNMVLSGDLGRIDVIHALFTELRTFGDKSSPWMFERKLSGGGPLADLGIYCVNTSRWLVDEDPIGATAISWARDPRRYAEVEEGISFRLDFASGLIVQGTTSYSAGFSSFLHVHGEKGWAEMAPAFAFEEERRMSGKIAGKWFAKKYEPVDEFAMELDYFARCVRENEKPKPDGVQGLRDMIIMEAIYRAAREGRAVKIAYDGLARGRS
jgi:predicted dehydrogenase